mmetsp:Transcript_139/g.303  ORF Transcript_139/g.303 Transcript_139/m.303 type:complete len:184 (-) Transcript_139:344-895(-)
MPPLGWTKKEAEKRGELGKGRPRAVELRDSVANIAPFEFADDRDEADIRKGGHQAALGDQIATQSAATSADGLQAQGQTAEPSATSAAAPPVRPKIWLRAPSGGLAQLCGSLRKFCEQQELEYAEVTKLLDGQADEYRGWRGGFGALPPTTSAQKPKESRRVRRRISSVSASTDTARERGRCN